MTYAFFFSVKMDRYKKRVSKIIFLFTETSNKIFKFLLFTMILMEEKFMTRHLFLEDRNIFLNWYIHTAILYCLKT